MLLAVYCQLCLSSFCFLFVLHFTVFRSFFHFLLLCFVSSLLFLCISFLFFLHISSLPLSKNYKQTYQISLVAVLFSTVIFLAQIIYFTCHRLSFFFFSFFFVICLSFIQVHNRAFLSDLPPYTSEYYISSSVSTDKIAIN